MDLGHLGSQMESGLFPSGTASFGWRSRVPDGPSGTRIWDSPQTRGVGAGPGGAWNRTPAARHLVHAGPPGPARLPRGASPFPAASRAARSGSSLPPAPGSTAARALAGLARGRWQGACPHFLGLPGAPSHGLARYVPLGPRGARLRAAAFKNDVARQLVHFRSRHGKSPGGRRGHGRACPRGRLMM